MFQPSDHFHQLAGPVERLVAWASHYRPYINHRFNTVHDSWDNLKFFQRKDFRLFRCAARGTWRDFRDEIEDLIEGGEEHRVTDPRPLNMFIFFRPNPPFQRMEGNLLAFLCLMGEYVKVRILLEEYAWLFRSKEAWYVTFMDAKFYLPLAMQVLSFFPKGRRSSPEEEARFDRPIYYHHRIQDFPIVPGMDFFSFVYFNTCYKQQRWLFNLLPLYMPACLRKGEDECVLPPWPEDVAPTTEGRGSWCRDRTLRFTSDQVMTAIGYTGGYRREPLSLKTLASVVLIRSLPGRGRRKSFALNAAKATGVHPDVFSGLHRLDYPLE